MNTHAFKLLVWNTLQKEIRSKTFVVTVILTISFLAMSYAILEIVKKEFFVESKIGLFVGMNQILWFYYGIINMWSIFLGIMFGLGCMKSDVAMGTIGQLLALPMSRRSYLLARILGSWLLVTFYQCLGFILTFWLFGAALAELKLVALLIAPLVSLMPTLGAIILGLFVSLWLNKTSGLVMTMLCSSGAHLAGLFYAGTNLQENLSLFKVIGLFLWTILPRFSAPNSLIHHLAKSSIAIEWSNLAQFGLSTALLLVVTCLIFERRGF